MLGGSPISYGTLTFFDCAKLSVGSNECSDCKESSLGPDTDNNAKRIVTVLLGQGVEHKNFHLTVILEALTIVTKIIYYLPTRY